MLAGVIGTVFGIAFTVGLVAFIVFLTAHRRAKKAGPNAWVEFSPRGFCGVLVFVGAVAVLMWAAVLMAINSEKPSWVFSIGIVFLIGLLRPVIQKMSGSMFVVSGEGRNAGSTGPALYPPTHFMTGETVPAQYAVPVAASACAEPEPAARPTAAKKPLTPRQADLRLLYLPAAAGVTVAVVPGFGGDWTAAGFLMGLAVVGALGYLAYRKTGHRLDQPGRRRQGARIRKRRKR